MSQLRFKLDAPQIQEHSIFSMPTYWVSLSQQASHTSSQQIPHIYGNWRFITLFTQACPMILSLSIFILSMTFVYKHLRKDHCTNHHLQISPTYSIVCLLTYFSSFSSTFCFPLHIKFVIKETNLGKKKSNSTKFISCTILTHPVVTYVQKCAWWMVAYHTTSHC